MTHILSAAVAIPLTMGVVLYGSKPLFLFLVAVVALIGCREYFELISRVGVEGFPKLGMALSFLLLLSFYFGSDYLLQWGLVAVVSVIAAWFLIEKDVKTAIAQISFTLFGIFYVAGLSGYYLLLREIGSGRQWLLFLFIVIWSGDIAAYYVGKNWGKSPLVQAVSPNKTIEGAVGGLSGNLVAAGVVSVWFLDSTPVWVNLIGALICGIIGQFGDLAESLLKRNAGIKDSGNLIPGHGGVLDRIDSLLFAGPALYCYLSLWH